MSLKFEHELLGERYKSQHVFVNINSFMIRRELRSNETPFSKTNTYYQLHILKIQKVKKNLICVEQKKKSNLKIELNQQNKTTTKIKLFEPQNSSPPKYSTFQSSVELQDNWIAVTKTICCISWFSVYLYFMSLVHLILFSITNKIKHYRTCRLQKPCLLSNFFL